MGRIDDGTHPSPFERFNHGEGQRERERDRGVDRETEGEEEDGYLFHLLL